MQIAKLAVEPELTEIQIENEELTKKYGEQLSFFTWDRLPLETFVKLANVNETNELDMISIIKPLMLDEKGKQVITGKKMLPKDVMVSTIKAITDTLGK